MGERVQYISFNAGLRQVVVSYLVALAITAYLPAQLLPLIADDYFQSPVKGTYTFGGKDRLAAFCNN